MLFSKVPIIALILLAIFESMEAGNILIFPMMSRSSLGSGTTIAAILNDAGHNVAIVVPTNDQPDVQKSPKYSILYFKTALSREKEQNLFSDAAEITPLNLLLGRTPNTFSDVLRHRCAGMLYDENLHQQLIQFAPDLAIVHLFMPCIIPHLIRMNVPFADFCSLTLTHSMCAYPHRIPSPPSYVQEEFFPLDTDTFAGRFGNTLVHILAPHLAMSVLFGGAQAELYTFQQRHRLPYATVYELRSKASLLLLHGDVTFETVRPATPKVVYIGGDQCSEPKPLDGDLKEFVESPQSYDGLIVFSLGGVLNTDILPLHFLTTFVDIFRELPRYRVVWKLKHVPDTLIGDIPSNVKVMSWLPQQDLLGHNRTAVFISHGGIQSSFESLCHGVPMLGIGVFADQKGNVKLLEKKGMALPLDDYKVLDKDEVKKKLIRLLTDKSFQKNAKMARDLYFDQPTTASERLIWTVNYTIRHKGAYHLTSQQALDLHWIQYYSLDVAVLLLLLTLFFLGLGYLFLKLIIALCIKSLCKLTVKDKHE